MDAQNKSVKLKDICDKVFKRNSIYPLMEIPKPDSKDTIEEQYKKQDKIVSGWISDVNIRIEAFERYKNKKNKNTENEVQRVFKANKTI